MSFPPTRRSVVERVRSGDAEVRHLALATIVEAYWKPVYKYLRLKWHLSPDDAADLTQEFFATALEKDWLSRYDATKARFRTYLRLCIDGLASNARKAEQRMKRGGGVVTVSLDFESAEGELRHHEPSAPADVEDLFYREWVRALFQSAVEDLRSHAHAAGRDAMFEVFRRYDLADDGDRRPTYSEIGAALGLTASTVTNHLAAMRRQLRTRLLARLRDLTTSDEEYEAEARRLLGGPR